MLAGRPGGRWAARLVRVYGLGWVTAGLFVVDPGNGFPVGSLPATSISWHAAVHLAAGQVSFIALIAACFVLRRRKT
nr:DUF998 domain-containing protein [Kibdelosporangium banguiense]